MASMQRFGPGCVRAQVYHGGPLPRAAVRNGGQAYGRNLNEFMK
jgi:hypothetical protein